jgi:hypothetical protein
MFLLFLAFRNLATTECLQRQIPACAQDRIKLSRPLMGAENKRLISTKTLLATKIDEMERANCIPDTKIAQVAAAEPAGVHRQMSISSSSDLKGASACERARHGKNAFPRAGIYAMCSRRDDAATSMVITGCTTQEMAC